MIEFLSHQDEVVACRLRREITPEDTDRLAAEMELALESCDTVHFYYEIDKGLEFSSASTLHGIRQALAMLAHRRQFGRIAVVSDDPILRSLWKAESALVPGLSYRVFKQRDRDAALAWIVGKGKFVEP